ncbi:substrate-binding domain-containing protein [Rhodoferax fermentans]|uniref:Sugar ABC transporter n=1 Tax=Rhodoferax fermentans TaxID=28066 RepID=A0A1T1AVG1_RHOFE|nr:substrate-binding domain-containing protein [Rhodoferax fermentans]MBK1682103.1 sugar ABC transporter substrate-binding protein [Rhodoferax fermentans]OOV08080.1 sugar ABC transporter [Rhodoferax fermentans]
MKFSTPLILSTLTLAVGSAFAADAPVIGLITKTETNPFFVKMKEGAKAEAEKAGAKLMSAAGKIDGDTAGQITALENMASAGAKTIMITSAGDAIIPTVKKIQAKGVQVIALDSPFEGADALFATDNYKAGVLIGQYAKAAMAGKPVKIAMLDLFPGHPVGAQRHNGFMAGFGLKANDAKSNELSTAPEIVCANDTNGDRAKGQTAMENCLQKDPGINVVYTINEPAAAGAYNALKKAGKEKGVLILSVDGGCQGIKDTEAGIITATSQQYPLKMASMGVAAGVEYAKTGKKATGYVDTGVTLIAKNAIAGVDSKDTKVGLDLCWGKK